MRTIFVNFAGVRLEVPDDPEFFWPHPSFEGFPTCCGAGKSGSIGDAMVLDQAFRLVFSPACWVHDWMFSHAERTTAEFHYANAVLFRNMLAIIAGAGKKLRRAQLKLATGMAMAYYDAVSTAGMVWFFMGEE